MSMRPTRQRAWALWLQAALVLLPLAQRSTASKAVAHAAESDEQLRQALMPVSRYGLPGWMETHVKYVDEIEAARSVRSSPWDVIAYGDSITEAFRATSVGSDMSFQYAANAAAWHELMRGKYKAQTFAIAGDKTMHLLWRLQNGEGPEGLHPKAISLMIGTNDVGHLVGLSKGDVQWAAHVLTLMVESVLKELRRQAPSAQIILHGLLPLQPHGIGQELSPAIAEINQHYKQHVAASGDKRLHYAECGTLFIDAQGDILPDLIPDGIHPAGAHGGRLLLQCMLDAVDRALHSG